MKTVSALLLILASAAAPSFAAAPVWDSSGNGLLSGQYYFRQVLYVADNTGTVSRALALYGNITFNAGAYTLSGVTLSDTNGGFQISANGTYSVSASGYGFLSNPLITGDSVSFLVSNHVLVGNDTASGYNGMFIAAPVSSLSASNFQGTYTMSAFFPGGTPDTAADATYQLTADGAGHISNVNLSGFAGTGTTFNENISGVTYKFSNNAAAMTFPTSNTNIYSGQEFVYFSPDTNLVFGGSPTGYDMFVGVRNASGASAPLSGLYYETGLEESGGTGIDSFYGAFNIVQGTVIGHERILYSGFSPEGLTYYSTAPTSASSSYQDSSATVQFTIGQSGYRLAYGLGGFLQVGIALPYTPPAATGAVYIEPAGIVNAASSAPYTAGISPGEFLTFYQGVNLASSTLVDTTFPTTLGNVKVLIDGIAAPIYYVSSTQVSVIVPYDVTTYPIASIQVSNNGALSNTVTMFVNVTTPGVFTIPSGGTNVAAAIDYPASGGAPYVVSGDLPARPGDTLAMYLAGLGLPFPSSPNGAPGTADSLVQTINVSIGGVAVPSGDLFYAGLAPSLTGLYQLNFKIPATSPAGNDTVSIQGPDSETDEAYVPLVAASGSARPATEAVQATRSAARRPTLPRLSVQRKP